MKRNIAAWVPCACGVIFTGLLGCGDSSTASPSATGSGGSSATTGGAAGDGTETAGSSNGTAGSDGSGGANAQGGSNATGGGNATGGSNGSGGAVADASTSPDAKAMPASDGGSGNIKNVFIVLEENHNWSQVNTLPYVMHLMQVGAHSEQYWNPKGNHPSEPNYIWLEAAKNFCLSGTNPCSTDDSDPGTNLVKGAVHLTKLLDAAGVSWTSYQENITGGQCPVSSGGGYAAKHNPVVFFDDVVGDPPSKTNAYCIKHNRPFAEFLPDLKAGNVARYNFITPTLDHDMHDGTPAAADAWLQMNIDPIINPLSPNHNPTIYAHSALFVTWDEGSGGDGPIGMLVVSPFAKVGYKDTKGADYYYTHSSTVFTMQRIFGVTGTPIADAANAKDLSDLFMAFP